MVAGVMIVIATAASPHYQGLHSFNSAGQTELRAEIERKN